MSCNELESLPFDYFVVKYVKSGRVALPPTLAEESRFRVRSRVFGFAAGAPPRI